MREMAGWILMCLAGLIGASNFYFSVLHYWVYRLLGWDYRWNSGFPAIGTLVLLIALACLWQDRAAWYLAGGIALIDTAGLPWFMVILFYYSLNPPKDPHAVERRGPEASE
jgi:hypothetical protein